MYKQAVRQMAQSICEAISLENLQEVSLENLQEASLENIQEIGE